MRTTVNDHFFAFAEVSKTQHFYFLPQHHGASFMLFPNTSIYRVWFLASCRI